MKKQIKKLNLNKINLVKFENENGVKGGADSAYCWTKPFNMCILSKKDLDCKPQEPIKLTLRSC
ncbi:hypothetical protein [Kordia zhangzhouensis]|uniref:hypothetical protein n=1 Tax=Kordia zhangzhouensis TaxID=1620405 RepID=UPI0006297842|nr:hypothetical protein [Kordia zhangzhouensis]